MRLMAIKQELYLSFLVDRSVGRPVCIASSAGGMEIEKVAAETPEKILRAERMPLKPGAAEPVPIDLGPLPGHLRIELGPSPVYVFFNKPSASK